MEPKRREQQEEHPTANKSRRSRVVAKLSHPKKPVVFAVLFFLILAVFIIGNWPTQSAEKPANNRGSSAPQYQTVLPSGKTIKDLGGWKKLTPPQGESFYTYKDSIDGVAVIVSQQQLPLAFQSNTNEKVAELAKNYNATSKLKVGGLTVYIGLSAKHPQSVIFTKDNLLVFIKSEDKISNASWKSYITSLGIPSSTDSAAY